MGSSHLQKFIWNGPISKNVSLKVISDVANCKFHAFIIKLNNLVFFWSITAGLIRATNHVNFFFVSLVFFFLILFINSTTIGTDLRNKSNPHTKTPRTLLFTETLFDTNA